MVVIQRSLAQRPTTLLDPEPLHEMQTPNSYGENVLWTPGVFEMDVSFGVHGSVQSREIKQNKKKIMKKLPRSSGSFRVASKKVDRKMRRSMLVFLNFRYNFLINVSKFLSSESDLNHISQQIATEQANCTEYVAQEISEEKNCTLNVHQNSDLFGEGESSSTNDGPEKASLVSADGEATSGSVEIDGQTAMKHNITRREKLNVSEMGREEFRWISFQLREEFGWISFQLKKVSIEVFVYPLISLIF